MSRPDRLLLLVARLRAERWQRAEDLARALDVSTRTIYRDMQALDAAGVPVVAVPGKGYRLRRDSGLAQRPLRLHQPAPASVFINQQPVEQGLLVPLRQAVAEQRVVQLQYDHKARTVHPYGLLRRGPRWVLVGYDRERKQVQYVRLRRVAEVKVLDEVFERPAGYHVTDAGLPPRNLTVRVRFAPAVAPWIQEAPPLYTDHLEEDADALILTLKVRREADVLPWLLSWGRHAQVLEPASLARRLAEEARRIAARYQAAPSLFPRGQ